MYDSARLAAAAVRTAEHDPFRLERHPAAVAFGTPDAPPPEAIPPSPVQGITLKGVTGPPWQAVLAGVPGHEANIVARVGDTLAGLRVTRVRRDRVVLAGRDTSLTMVLTRTWQ